MGAIRGAGAPARPSSRWRFGPATFDEATWTLTVDGRAVAIEGKPLELLRELLRREGAVATKSELLDAVWPDVSVVEGSLPTAIGKLRRALGDDRSEAPIVATVPRVGYRLAVPATREAVLARPTIAPVAQPSGRPRPGRRMLAGAALAAAGVLGLAGWSLPRGSSTAARPVTAAEMQLAVRRLDLPRVDALLARGFDPNTPVGAQRNTVLNTLLETCEWNPGHQQRVLMIARTLIDAGARVDLRNYWGDTAYSIASAPRNCGPDHPVTKLLRLACDDGAGGVRPACRARYVHQGEPAPGP